MKIFFLLSILFVIVKSALFHRLECLHCLTIVFVGFFAATWPWAMWCSIVCHFDECDSVVTENKVSVTQSSLVHDHLAATGSLGKTYSLTKWEKASLGLFCSLTDICIYLPLAGNMQTCLRTLEKVWLQSKSCVSGLQPTRATFTL